MVTIFIYTNSQFGWTSEDVGYYLFVASGSKMVAISLIVPVLSQIAMIPKDENERPSVEETVRLLESEIHSSTEDISVQEQNDTVIQLSLSKSKYWVDGWVIRIGISVLCLSFLGVALATEGWMLYAITLVESGAIIAVPTLRAVMSKTFGPSSRQGSLLSSAGILESIGTTFSSIFFTFIYRHTVDTHANVVFFVMSGLFFVCLIGSLLISRKQVEIAEMEQRRLDGYVD